MSEFRSGFVTVVGRPNAGKSSLINTLIGTKVSIVSDKVQTTRNAVRAVMTLDDAQVIFVDTPGMHKPQNKLGERLNDAATDNISGVDLAVFVIDATKPFGTGDQFVVDKMHAPSSICVVNKIDRATPPQILAQLTKLAAFDFKAYYPVSAKTGDGVEELRAALVADMPEGPMMYPVETVRDTPDAFWVGELVREQLLAVLNEELPHSVACQVTEWEWPRVRCEIVVERDSQKGIVIGKGGAVLKEVGIRAREQLDPDMFLELFVRVDPHWQNRDRSLDRLGL